MDAPSTSTAATTANSAAAQKPKIDPLQLLKCLSILLNPRGGIRGETEVQRVKGLMAKYSKKLVSKCIYLNILQATDLPLIDLFYEEGGWELVGVWLQEAVNTKNWPLATQVLSLLESSPMTVARLKRNTTPKLVKELSKDSSSPGVQVVAKHLVLKWMEVVRHGDGVATAAGVGLANTINNSADEDSVEIPTHHAEIPNEQTSMDVDGELEESTHTATADSSQGEGGYGSSSLSCQDESSNTSTESDITPAPTTPIRITIRSGSQVLAKVSSQRLSQDSTDSDDNKPLSIIKQKAEKSRTSSPVGGGTINNENSSTDSVRSLDTGDDTSGNAAAAGSLETDSAGSENIKSTSGMNVNSVTVNTSAVTISSTMPSTESTTTTTTTSAIHTIVTFTGSLAANNPQVVKSSPTSTQSNTTSPPPDTKDQGSPVAEKKSDINGVSADTKVESVTSKSANKVDSGNKSEVKSEMKCEVKSEKDKKSDTNKDKDRDRDRDKDRERERDRRSRDSDKKKDKDKSKNSKSSGNNSSSSSSSSSKSDRDRVKSSKDNERSKGDKHRSSSTKDKDRRDKDRSKSSRDKISSSKDKDKHREKDKDKDKERREDKKKKEQQENEDKATLEKVKPLSADGLAKIPRKQTPASFLDALGSADVELQEAKKPTVKTYKSRGFRNTGLLDEPTKLPGVAGKKVAEKKPAAGVSLAGGMKRNSPLEDLAAIPPDKRTRTSVSSLPLNADKPGGVKLISPKRPSLSDDGGFMAALTAAGPETRKKVTRKRKSSESDPKGEVKEEEGGSPSSSPVKADDKSDILSPTSVRPTFNFYQETLKDYDDEEDADKTEDDEAEKTEGSEEMETRDTEGENEDNDIQNEIQEGDVEMKNEGAEDDPRTINMDVDESETKDECVQPGEGDGGGDGSDSDPAKETEIPHAPAVPAPAQEDYEKVEVIFSAPNPSIRSVLVYHRPASRKKKAVKWRTEDDLKEIFYFELDETERVNVNSVKFNELMVMERQREREAMGKGRALHGNMGLLGGSISSFGGMGNMGDEHMMGGLGMPHNMTNVRVFMRWSLLPVMLTGQPNISPGCRSQERVIQAARESSTMAAFFHPAMLPDTPREPDPELVVRVDPKEVPLLDVSGQDNIHDHRNKLWPEPIINEPMNYGYGGIGAMGNMGGMPGGSSAGGGGSHWVIGGPPSGGFAGGPMYGGPGGPGGYGGPGPGNFGGEMGGGMDGPGWGGPGPEFPNPNMMMGSGGPGMMMGARPNMAPRGMMSNMGMGGGPRFRGRGGGWGGPRSGPPACKHFMNGHCRHGKNCKFLHPKQY